MKKRFIVQVSLAFLLIVLVVSCGPFSKHPLSDPSQKQFDERINGLWMFSDDSDKVYLHFGKSKDNRTQIIYVEHKDDLSLDFGLFTMYPTVIDKVSFGNFQFLDETGNISKENDGYMFFKYSLNKENNKLSVAFMNADLVDKSVADGELVGVVPGEVISESPDTKTKLVSTITKISDSSKNIINFIKSKDLEKLFSNIMTFRKANE